MAPPLRSKLPLRLPDRILHEGRCLGDFIGIDREEIVAREDLSRGKLLALDALHPVFLAVHDHFSIGLVPYALHSVHIVLGLRILAVAAVEPGLGPCLDRHCEIALLAAEFGRIGHYSLVAYCEVSVVLEEELNPALTLNVVASYGLVSVKRCRDRLHE